MLRRVLLVVLGVYATAAGVGYLLLRALWAAPPDPWTAVAAIAIAAVLSGYLSYRVGTAELLAGLEARPLPEKRAPALYRHRVTFADRTGVAPPRLLVADLGAPNAISLGGGRGVVVFDLRPFRVLDADERVALLAHEFAHLESRDGLVQTLAYTAARTAVDLLLLAASPVVVLAAGVVRGRPARGSAFAVAGRVVGRLVVVALLGVTVLVRAHSRRREFRADDRAADLTGDPLALASALRRIRRAADPRGGPLAPLYVQNDDATRLFATHPSTEKRIQWLLARAERSAGGIQR